MSESLVVVLLLTASVGVLSMAGKEGENGKIKCVTRPVTARRGGAVSINCTYARAAGVGATKRFCRRDGNAGCTNVIETYASNYTKRHRFSLADYKERGVFTVTISELTQNDTGGYWCALARNDSSACLKGIELRVLNDTIRGQTGKGAKIYCPYPGGQPLNSKKHLCKGEDPFNCSVLVHTIADKRYFQEGRFHILDNSRLNHFYVKIRNLTAADTGTYWCGGSGGTWLHTGNVLFVGGESHAQTKKSRPEAQWTTMAKTLRDDHFSFAMIGVTVVGLALLATVGTVLILCRAKLTKGSSAQCTTVGQNAERTDRDHDYEEIHLPSQEPRSGEAPFSSVYAEINPPAAQPTYASVTFHQSLEVTEDGNARTDADKTISSACEYSSVRV